MVPTGDRWRMHDLARLYADQLSEEHPQADGPEQARDRRSPLPGNHGRRNAPHEPPRTWRASPQSGSAVWLVGSEAEELYSAGGGDTVGVADASCRQAAWPYKWPYSGPRTPGESGFLQVN